MSSPSELQSLVVGGGAARARAHEARASTPPVSREVRAAARRGASRPLREARWARARPVRRVGDDARPVPRVRLRRGRCRRRGVQLPADAREDRRVRPLPAGDRSPMRPRASRAVARAPARIRARVVRARTRPRSFSTSARSSTTTSTPTSFASCSRVPRAPPGSRRTSTSTSRGRHSASRTGATSIGARAPPCRRPTSSSSRYLLDTLERLKAFQKVRARGRSGRRSSTATTSDVALDGRFDGIVTSPPYPGPDRLPRAAPLRIRASRPRRSPRAGARCSRPAERVAARSRSTSRASRPCCAQPPQLLAAWRPVPRRRQRSPRPLSGDPASGAACASSTGSSATSTVVPGGVRASTSSRFSSVYGKRKRSVRVLGVGRPPG